MSVEVAMSSEMAKPEKKRRKDKESRDPDRKKRKREEAQQDNATPLQPDKRAKKQKPEEEKRQERNRIDDSPVERSAKKRERKDKRSKDKAKTTPAPRSDELLRTHSPFVKQTTSFYLPLSPCAYNFPLEGLCAEHISPLLLTYYPPLSAVVLSYSNPRISEHPTEAAQIKSSSHAKEVLGQSLNEYAVSYVWLTADFTLFRPQGGSWLEGYVNMQNESVLGLMCYNYFNAVVSREQMPEGWNWTGESNGPGRPHKKAIAEDGNGFWVDDAGAQVEGKVMFRVLDFEASPDVDGSGGTVSIVGTLLDGT